MSHSTNSELEKDVGLEKDVSLENDEGQIHLSEAQENIVESLEPPFTADEDVENPEKSIAGGGDGASLAQVPSSKLSLNNIRSVPNGGLKAWMQVVGSFFVFFNTWGIINAFGTYQTYYVSGILSSSNPSDISWIGSLQAFLLMIVGSLAGPIYDAGYIHTLLLVGSFLIVFGQMMLSLCTEYWQVILAQGFCVGIGTGLIFVTGVAILSTYFSTRIATATGIAAAGSSIGGMLYPIVFHHLQPKIGFAWSTRVLGFIALATLAVSNSCLRVRVLPAQRRRFLDPDAWKEMPYVFFNVGSFFIFLGLYAPFFYVQLYCIETGIMHPSLAFYLLAILNAASTFGRLIPNIIADHVGPLNTIVPSTFMAGILCLCLISAKNSASVIVIIAFYGFFSGTLVSLPPTIYVHLAGPNNRKRIGTRMGMGFAFVGVGTLVGTPICGAILNVAGFKYVWLFGGIMVCFGACFVFLSRMAQSGWVLLKKV